MIEFETETGFSIQENVCNNSYINSSIRQTGNKRNNKTLMKICSLFAVKNYRRKKNNKKHFFRLDGLLLLKYSRVNLFVEANELVILFFKTLDQLFVGHSKIYKYLPNKKKRKQTSTYS